MRRKSQSNRLTLRLILLMIIITISCDNNEFEKEILSGNNLESILNTNQDFSKFIELPYQNNLTLNSLDAQQRERLKYLYQNLNSTSFGEIDFF